MLICTEWDNEEGIRTKISPFIVAGIVVILAILLFDIAWFSFSSKDSQHLVYQVKVTPSSDAPWTVTVPTLVDGNGRETEAASRITASKPAQVGHISTQFGRALWVNSSGSLTLGIDIGEWGGSPSLNEYYGGKAHVRVRSHAVEDFVVQIEIIYSYESESERSNVFGERNGMWGGSIEKFNVSGSISSTSDWTILEGERDGICYDATGNASRDGLIISTAGYSASVVLAVIGVRKRSGALLRRE